MIEGQAKPLGQLRGYVDELEAALRAERWADADLALAGIELRVDEIRRGMPHPIVDAGPNAGPLG